eukprot:363785-Chlamydomonas_euryale.AAC.15
MAPRGPAAASMPSGKQDCWARRHEFGATFVARLYDTRLETSNARSGGKPARAFFVTFVKLWWTRWQWL